MLGDIEGVKTYINDIKNIMKQHLQGVDQNVHHDKNADTFAASTLGQVLGKNGYLKY